MNSSAPFLACFLAILVATTLDAVVNMGQLGEFCGFSQFNTTTNVTDWFTCQQDLTCAFANASAASGQCLPTAKPGGICNGQVPFPPQCPVGFLCKDDPTTATLDPVTGTALTVPSGTCVNSKLGDQQADLATARFLAKANKHAAALRAKEDEEQRELANPGFSDPAYDQQTAFYGGKKKKNTERKPKHKVKKVKKKKSHHTY